MAGIMQDPYGRILEYVRISVTDRCNYRCRYCMPSEGVEWIPHEEIMSYENILFLCQVFVELGVKKIRFTGGEPFVRKGFVPFLEEVREKLPGLRIAVTTNGTMLEETAGRLSGLGLESVNVSLDTLDPERFRHVTVTGDLEKVIRGIDALCAEKNVPVKINTVAMKHFNDDEVSSVVKFAGERNILARFIEFMPLDRDVWSQDKYISARDILSLLPVRELWHPCPSAGNSDVCGPSRYYRNASTGQKVGVISAVSEHFCLLCNRLRVTSVGVVRPCLFGNFGVPVIEALRKKDRNSLKKRILEAVAAKPRRGETGIPSEDGLCEERHMSQIGG